MNSSPAYNHEHIVHRIGWLRAATLGANDGIISISSLLVGMASSGAAAPVILAAGVAGLVAGAASMAAGEWVSVKSQADAEEAELALEQRHIDNNPKQELLELQSLYQKRGLPENLARDVAVALTKHDALGAHAQDELGITLHSVAKPMQAAFASALTFTAGGVVPLLVLLLALALRRQLDALLLSDDSARTLGVNTRRLRLVLLLATALLTACIVSQCGGIAFVGLMIPHIVRHFFGVTSARLLLAAR